MDVIIINPLNNIINSNKKPDWVDCDNCIIIDPIKRMFRCNICTKGRLTRRHIQKDILANINKKDILEK
jgi:hypothetical protein